jgi:hypothetical protein
MNATPCFCGKTVLESGRCEGGHTQGQRAIRFHRQGASVDPGRLPGGIAGRSDRSQMASFAKTGFAKEKQNEPNEFLNAALVYADQGWPVFPCERGGKKPLTANGFKDATTDKNTICAWWAKWPDANIGSPMGGDRIVIDMDGSEADQSMVELERKYGKLPDTLQAKTARGCHLYFNPSGAKIKPSAGVLGPHLDVRGEGSYVILPPSVHASGARYEWREAPMAALAEAMATLPEAWLKLLSSPPRPEDRPEAKKIPEGQRNLHLTSLAGSMRRRDMGEAAIEAALLKENQERCHPPLPDEEVRTIARSVGRYEPALQPGFQLVPLAI